MKNIFRALVVVLTLTGAAAAAHVSLAAENGGTHLSLAKTSAFPVPTCPPDDPNACGMGGGMGN